MHVVHSVYPLDADEAFNQRVQSWLTDITPIKTIDAQRELDRPSSPLPLLSTPPPSQHLTNRKRARSAGGFPSMSRRAVSPVKRRRTDLEGGSLEDYASTLSLDSGRSETSRRMTTGTSPSTSRQTSPKRLADFSKKRLSLARPPINFNTQPTRALPPKASRLKAFLEEELERSFIPKGLAVGAASRSMSYSSLISVVTGPTDEFASTPRRQNR